MKVLISGGAGFIGLHLTRALLERGHAVTVIDNFSPQIHHNKDELPRELRDHVRLVRGDVREASAWAEALPGQEAVVNLAAETGTGQSMYQVAKYEQVNLAGTARLYDLLAQNPRHGVERIVVASSRAIYGEGAYRCAQHGVVYPRPRTSVEKKEGLFDPVCPECGAPCSSVPTPESAPLQPSSFYALTKQVQEQMTLLFAQTLAIPSLALRYQNVYGPGQSLNNPYTGILAIFSNLARVNAPIHIFEDGKESRDFVHVADVAEATCRALEKPIVASVSLNVGTGTAVPVSRVVERIVGYFQSQSPATITGAFREGDIRHNTADTTRLEETLHFKPARGFDEGIEDFLDWATRQEVGAGSYERSLAEMRERGLFHA